MLPIKPAPPPPAVINHQKVEAPPAPHITGLPTTTDMDAPGVTLKVQYAKAHQPPPLATVLAGEFHTPPPAPTATTLTLVTPTGTTQVKLPGVVYICSPRGGPQEVTLLLPIGLVPDGHIIGLLFPAGQ